MASVSSISLSTFNRSTLLHRTTTTTTSTTTNTTYVSFPIRPKLARSTDRLSDLKPSHFSAREVSADVSVDIAPKSKRSCVDAGGFSTLGFGFVPHNSGLRGPQNSLFLFPLRTLLRWTPSPSGPPICQMRRKSLEVAKL